MRRTWSSAATSETPGSASNACTGTGPENRSSTWWWARSRRPSTLSTLTSRPSRMIATRSAVRSTSLRMWLERKTVRPSVLRFADERVERLLDERVEARRRLVEDEQLRAGAGAR